MEPDRSTGEIGDELRERIALRVEWSVSHARRLVRWMIRTLLGLAICGVLAWKFGWGKWALAGYVVLASLSLAALLISNRVMERKFRESLRERSRSGPFP